MNDTTATVYGQVVRDASGRMWVDVPRRSACHSCEKTSGCSMSVLGGLVGGQTTRLPIDGLDMRDGETVQLSCPSEGLLKAAFLAYGLPAFAMVVGALVAATLTVSDLYQALGAAGGLALGVLITRWLVARGHLPTMTLNEE